MRNALVTQGKLFGSLQQMVERLDARQAEHDSTTATMKVRFEALESRVSGMEARIGAIETHLVSMDAKLDSLVALLKMMIPTASPL